MKKAIIILGGDDEGKSRFIDVVKGTSWVWRCFSNNPKKIVRNAANLESFQKSEINREGKTFDKLVLITNGGKCDLELKEDYGAIEVYIGMESDRNNHDVVIDRFCPNFERKVEETIDILTKEF